MKKNLFNKMLVVLFAAVGISIFSAVIAMAGESRCIRSGCNNRQSSGSSYCYLHKPYTGSSLSQKNSSYSSKKTWGSSSKSSSGSLSGSSYRNKSKTTAKSTYKSSCGSSMKKSTATKKSTYSAYDSYDDGYDDIYMDGDYDYDRYDRDRDYADGVDDAMDECGGDW